MCDSLATLKTLLDAGYTPQSAIDAVQADDLSRLRHEGRFSVQLQPQEEDEDDPPTR